MTNNNITNFILLAVLMIASAMSGCVEDAPITTADMPAATPTEITTPEPTIIEKIIEAAQSPDIEIIDVQDGFLTMTGYVIWDDEEFVELECNFDFTVNANGSSLCNKGTITQKYCENPVCDCTSDMIIPDDFLPIHVRQSMSGDYSNITHMNHNTGEITYRDILPDDFDNTKCISRSAAITPFMPRE